MRAEKKIYGLLHLLVIIISLFLVTSCGTQKKSEIAQKPVPKYNDYGLRIDSLTEHKEVIYPNQTLADILLPYNEPYQRITDIAQKSKDIFFVRKFKVGDEYSIYTKPGDSTETVQYLVYEKDPVNYVVFDLRDSINIYEGKKEVTYKDRSVSGIINSSLYETLDEENLDPNIALKLSDVFAWQIDFYRIQHGDYFKAVYEEEYVAGKPVGIGRIKAAVFNHRGDDYYAFYYAQNENDNYFDEKGNSLRKQFLKAPLKFSRISSGFSTRRLHPISHRYKPHLGIDYAAPTGTPVRAIGDGVVLEAHYKRGNGNYIRIKHNSTYASGYMHLSKYAKGIKPGARVKQGQVIGYVGMTGSATGPHLDFRFWKNNAMLNYLTVKFPPSYPIDNAHREDYMKIKDEWEVKLDSINVEPKEEKQIATLEKTDSKSN